MSEGLKNPTNWPDPERPGVPPNSEVSGWHWVMRLGELIAVKWDAPSRSWRSGNHSYYTGPDWALNWEYCSPILTPNQLAELLAGERERCAKVCDAIATSVSNEWKATAYDSDNRAGDAAEETAEICAQKIRNLGAKP